MKNARIVIQFVQGVLQNITIEEKEFLYIFINASIVKKDLQSKENMIYTTTKEIYAKENICVVTAEKN